MMLQKKDFDSCKRANKSRAFDILMITAIVLLTLNGDSTWGWASPLDKRFSVEFETGAVWQSRNEIHIPDSAEGTRFSLADLQGSAPNVQRRVEAIWKVSNRHFLRFVYAPLNFSGSGTFASPVLFAGGSFTPGTAVDTEYKFDSYRVTYRYQFYESERWRLKIGVTALVRDAKVELKQQAVTASDSDIGVVPLLSANMEFALAPRWTALVDFDGLVSPQGRAIDAAAKIRFDLTDNWYVSAGYRVFEGGVDNNERFAFGWYNFAVVSLGARF